MVGTVTGFEVPICPKKYSVNLLHSEHLDDIYIEEIGESTGHN
jgi:hypothetical protein